MGNNLISDAVGKIMAKTGATLEEVYTLEAAHLTKVQKVMLGYEPTEADEVNWLQFYANRPEDFKELLNQYRIENCPVEAEEVSGPYKFCDVDGDPFTEVGIEKFLDCLADYAEFEDESPIVNSTIDEVTGVRYQYIKGFFMNDGTFPALSMRTWIEALGNSIETGENTNLDKPETTVADVNDYKSTSPYFTGQLRELRIMDRTEVQQWDGSEWRTVIIVANV